MRALAGRDEVQFIFVFKGWEKNRYLNTAMIFPGSDFSITTYSQFLQASFMQCDPNPFTI